MILNKLVKTGWATFLFTCPFSYSFVLYEQNSYRFGHFNPWVTGFLFLPEVLLGLTMIFWLMSRFPYQNLNSNFGFRISGLRDGWIAGLASLFLINAFLITFWQGDMSLFAFFLIRVVEAVCIVTLLADQVLEKRQVIRILLYGALFQLLIAFFQWQFNHSLGLWFLGEPVIGPDVLNVAKNNLSETVKQIRPYGTFLHPNILAAYFLTLLTLSLNYLKKGKLIFWVLLLSIGIFLTSSLAAKLALGFIFGFILLQKLVRSNQRKWITHAALGLILLGNLFLFFNSATLRPTDDSTQERLEQIEISQNMIAERPLGVGLWNFTLEMERFSEQKLPPWQFQPVHNTYFLIMNETGIQGLFLLILLMAFLFIQNTSNLSLPLSKRRAPGEFSIAESEDINPRRKYQMTQALPLLTLLFIASFDHYLWDSWHGMVLVALVLGFGFMEKANLRK